MSWDLFGLGVEVEEGLLKGRGGVWVLVLLDPKIPEKDLETSVPLNVKVDSLVVLVF